MTATTTPPRDPPIRSDYELDDVATKVQFATLDRLIEKQERAPRSDYELDDVECRVLIETWEKAVERDERRNREKIVGLLKTRAWDLAASRVAPGNT